MATLTVGPDRAELAMKALPVIKTGPLNDIGGASVLLKNLLLSLSFNIFDMIILRLETTIDHNVLPPRKTKKSK